MFELVKVEQAPYFQAVGRTEGAGETKLFKGLGPAGALCSPHWQWLESVLVQRGTKKKLQCLLKCQRGGEHVASSSAVRIQPKHELGDNGVCKGVNPFEELFSCCLELILRYTCLLK